MRSTIRFLAALLLCSSGPALADGPPHTLLAYGKVGGLIPVSKLGPHVSVRLGGGYIPPFLAGRLAAVVDLGYSQTSTGSSFTDPRVGDSGAEVSYTMTQRDLNLFIGPQYFILGPRHWIAPFAAVGLDLHFLQSVVQGDGGASGLGQNRETSTKVGFAVRAGAGYRLGPGIITAEASFAWAPIDHDITGESHLGHIALLAGYTVILGL